MKKRTKLLSLFLSFCLIVGLLGIGYVPVPILFAESVQNSDVQDVVQTVGGLTEKEEDDYTQEISDIHEDAVNEYVEDNGDLTGIEDEKYATKALLVKTTYYDAQQLQELSEAETVTKGYFEKYILRFATENKTKTAYQRLLKLDQIEKVYVDKVFQVDEFPSSTTANAWEDDSYTAMGFDAVKAQAAAGSDVTVAVIDTGANPKANIDGEVLGDRLDTDSWNVFSNKSISDVDGHGTHVSGIVTRNTPPNVLVEALGIADSRGELSSNSIIESAIVKAVNDDVDVINMSLGGYDETESDDMWDDALASAYQNGIPVCCAAGNADTGYVRNVAYTYPACSAYTWAISAIGSDYNLAYYSFYAMNPTDAKSKITFTAPGTGVYSYANSSRTGRYAEMSGTSQASPHIAAACAIVAAVFKADYDLSVKNFEEELTYYCSRCNDNASYYGAGLPVFPAEMTKQFAVDEPEPIQQPTASPTISPTVVPTQQAQATASPTIAPTGQPTASPRVSPTVVPTRRPTTSPSITPTAVPIQQPTISPTVAPTQQPADHTFAPITSPTVITVSKAKISKKTSYKKKIKLVIKPQTLCTYQIRYSKKKSMSTYRKKKCVKNKVTIKSLKRKTRYYIKVRAIKNVNGKNYYGKWSKKYKVKTM